ncbi:VOC family protein [Rhodothermus marinus]|uniref:Glyoxalase/bleomycin resistance protein/dioxygenase n=1 Tax=Rhodothermus marinus (strain ATCC 43812 / DSM 4252 / R-10) TaxID=518766 RepID=D0MEN3_RHOM4|nr:VOC family protein [Rhodothermus marinus]ACY49261.1 Glyoxalase/bleomycin resistance protein/dioxygenase [Rhodothermus marinus DSM 4252]
MHATFPLRIRALTLRVRDLNVQRAFYHELLGLSVREPAADRLVLAPESGTFTLELIADPSAPLRPWPTIGLYHFALLLPDRTALAAVAARLLAQSVFFEGAADHAVSEALYFRDPEGNGLELYTDRPPEQWPRRGPLMVTEPLDLEALLRGARPAPLPPDVRIGHLHLHVPDLDEAERFFAGRLGMTVTLRTYPGARFFAYDGYHHHVGANIWARGRRAPEHATGLLAYTLQVPEAIARTLPPALQDPAGITVHIRTAST